MIPPSQLYPTESTAVPRLAVGSAQMPKQSLLPKCSWSVMLAVLTFQVPVAEGYAGSFAAN